MSRCYHKSFFALLCLVSAAVVGTGASAAERGTLLYEYWSGISGVSVSDLTADARYPLSPSERSYLTSFEFSSRGDNYGSRLRATLHPDQTGEYRFLIAGDDRCELWLSTSADPSLKQRIAHVPGYTAVRQWTKYTQQQSVVITLTAGAAYYIEAIHKEGVGGDHLAVAWTGPGIGEVPTVITGAYLSPWPAPIITGDRTFTESTTVSITATVPEATIVYTTDGSQPTATSPQFVAPFTVSDFTVVTAGILTPDGTVNADVVRVVFRKVGTGTGLSADYYANENLTGTPIERIDPVVNFNWGKSAPLTNVPSDHFSVRWQGEIETFLSEPHTLTIRSDDGVRVWLNGVLMINDWTYHSAKDVSCVLPPGRHALDIEYKEGTGSAVAQLFWSSARIPREIVPSTQLYPLTAVRGVIPPTSAVSPYYLQIAHRPAPSATVAGVATPMQQLDDLIHYLNVPLSPDQPTPVTIDGGGNGEPLVGEITWSPTILSGHTYTTIRAGDSLLLGFPQAGNLTITTSSGTYLPTQPVTEGQQKPTRFTAGGIYTVRLTSPEGIEVATLDVTAVAADLSGTVLAEVGYTRAVNVPILPANAPVTFSGNSALKVATDSIAQNLADLRVTPLKRGTPRLQARINGPNGPLIGDQEIHEFTIDQTALRSAVINAQTNIGTSVLVMRPFIPNQRFTFTMFAHSATFAGGARTLTIDTNGGPSSNGEAPMVQQWDTTTNEMIGVFRFDLEVPEYESKYCYRVSRHQLPNHQTGAYLPTTTGGVMLSHTGLLTASQALLMGSSHESPIPDGPTSNINGDSCKVDAFKSLVFTQAEYYEMHGYENWSARQWYLWTKSECVVGQTGDDDCSGVTYRLKVSGPPAFNGELDDPKKALFGASINTSDPEPCSGTCVKMKAAMDSGTIPGKYTTTVEPYTSGINNDIVGSTTGGTFYVSKLDAHGEGDTREDVKAFTSTLPKRPGTVYQPVIQINAGGDGSVAGCSLYGTLCPAQNTWSFTAIARDLDGSSARPAGYAIKWTNIPGGDQTSETITVTFPVGRHFPRLEVWYADPSVPEDSRVPVLVGKAAIHSIVVEEYSAANCAIANAPLTLPSGQCPGTEFYLTNNVDGSTMVDARLSLQGLPYSPLLPYALARGRVSLDGYPQNEYWVHNELDLHDLQQVVGVPDGEAQKYYMQGYRWASPEREPNLKLLIEGQALIEVCESECDRFKDSPVAVEWQTTDDELTRATIIDGEWSGQQEVTVPLGATKNILAQFQNISSCPETFIFKHFDVGHFGRDLPLSLKVEPEFNLEKELAYEEIQKFTIIAKNHDTEKKPDPLQRNGINGHDPQPGEVWDWVIETGLIYQVTLREETTWETHVINIRAEHWVWKRVGDGVFDPPTERDGYKNPQSYTSDGRYRGVDLYGIPKSDASPTGEGENDRIPDETTVDMMNLSPTYTRTDISLPCEGGELAIEFRRTGGIRSLDVTGDMRRVASRLALPNQLLTGHGWSTNLGAHVSLDLVSFSGIISATVTDELGESLKYAWSGSSPNGATFTPLSTVDGGDHRAMKAKLETIASVNQYPVALRLTKRFGTKVEYEMVDDFGTADGKSVKRIFRISRVIDRNGNALVYTYLDASERLETPDPDHRLLVASIHEEAHPARRLTFSYNKLYANQFELDTGWRLTGVTDPSGRTITYEYENYGSATNEPYVWIGSSLAPLPVIFAPAQCALLARVIRPPNVVNGDDSTRPTTRFTYRIGDVTPRYFIVQGDLAFTPVTRFIAPKQITDARDHVTEFSYDYEEFPAIRYYDPPQANLCLRSITTNAGTMTVATAERERGKIRTQATSTDLTETNYAFTLEPENPVYSLGDILVKCERTTTVGGVPKTATYEYARNLFGNITKVTDINGNIITYEYENGDANDPANASVNPALYALRAEDRPNTYQLLSMPCKRTVAPGVLNLVTQYRRDTTFRALITETDAEGVVTKHILDAKGNRTGIIEAFGTAMQRTTSFKYAADGFMAETTDPDGRLTEFVRTFSDATVTPATADRTTYRTVVTKRFPGIDPQTQQPIVLTSTSSENLYGDKLAAIDGNGNRTDFVYDPHHRLIVTLSPATEIPVRSNAYLADTPVAERHELPSDLANADMPANGMVRARSDAFYDLNGNAVRQVDDNGHVTVMTYDYHNRPLTVRRRMVEATVDHADDIVTSASYTPRGQVRRSTDARGNYTETTYDELSRPVEISMPPLTPDGERLTQHFIYGNNSGAGTWTVRGGWQATRVIDARGFATDTTYDAIYRPIRVVRRHGTPPEDESAAPDTFDQVSETTYNRVHKPVRVLVRDEGERWRATLTYYDRLYRVSATVLTYGDQATLSGPELISGFRDDGFVVHAGMFSTRDYTLDVRILATRYDRAGNVVQTRDPLLRITDKTYDLAGRLKMTQAPAVSDAANDNALTRPTTTISYDGNSNPEIAVDARGTQSKSFYDARNRVVASITDLDGDGQFETNGDDIAVSSAYDLANQVVQTTDPRGFITDQYRDAAGRVVITEMPAVANAEAGGALQRPSIVTTYDANGNAIRMRDAREVVTQTAFDAYNRPIEVQAALGTPDAVTTSTTYDANGNALSLTLVNGSQPQTTTYTYDSFNRKTSEVLPDNGDNIERRTTWQYTRVNEVRHKREPAGNELDTDYDGFGQAIRVEVSAVGSLLTRVMTYTPTGKLESVVEGESNTDGLRRSRTTSYSYDQLDRQTAETFASGSESPHSVISGYDLNGNRVIAVTEIVATATAPATTRVTRSTFDNANRVLTISDEGRVLPSGGFATTTYAYDLAGNRLSLQRPDGIVDAYQYDALNRVLLATTTGPGQATGNLYQVSYTYDLVGNRRTATESTAGLGTRALVYAYDQQYRLTGEAETTSARIRTSTWHYDQAGNRTQQIQIQHETPPAPAAAITRTTTTEYDVDVLNRLTQWTATTVVSSDGSPSSPSIVQCQYAYDANGNQTEDRQTLISAPEAAPEVTKHHRFQWDGLNRLMAVVDLLHSETQPIFAAEYDARTRRRLTHEGTTTTQFRYDGGDAYQEHTEQGPTAFLARGSSMGGGIGGVLYSDRSAAAGPIETFVYNPAVGHTVGTVGIDAAMASANSYDAFGQIIDRIGASANNRLANTKERSESIGLDNHGFRYYNPITGRYISADPLGFAAGTMNFYAYVGNNPINKIDPLGLIEREELESQYAALAEQASAIRETIAGGGDASGAYKQYLSGYNQLNRTSGEFLDEQWITSGADIEAASLVNSLPMTFQGIKASLGELKGVREAQEAHGAALEGTIQDLGRQEAALEVVETVGTVAGAATGVGLVATIGKEALKQGFKEGVKHVAKTGINQVAKEWGKDLGEAAKAAKGAANLISSIKKVNVMTPYGPGANVRGMKYVEALNKAGKRVFAIERHNHGKDPRPRTHFHLGSTNSQLKKHRPGEGGWRGAWEQLKKMGEK